MSIIASLLFPCSDKLIKRVGMALTGTLLIAICLGVNMSLNLGLDPYSAMVTGFSLLSHQSFSLIFMLVTGILFISALFFNLKLLGVTTVLNLFLLGPIAQVVRDFLVSHAVFEALPVKFIGLAINLIILCLASSLYMTAGLGVSAYDAQPIILSERSPLSFRVSRMIADGLCALLGLMLGAPIGLVTLVTALALGPVIDLFNRKFSRPLLERD